MSSMETQLRIRALAWVLAICALPAFTPARSADAAATDDIPSAIAGPEGSALRLRLTAEGVQIYECREAQPGQFEWKFTAPEATLRDARGEVVVRHGAGPTWEATDGSKISGKVLARAPAPDGKSIPWLLLEAATAHEGAALAGVTHVQRILTSGGSAPAQGCSAATAKAVARVPYTSVYRFLSPAAPAAPALSY